MDAFRSRIEGRGFEALAALKLEPKGEVLYLRGKGQKWPLIEVGQFPKTIYDFFDLAKSASVNWDGSDPVRSL